MMKKMILIVNLLCSLVWAEDVLDEAQKYYDQGSYAKAASLWKPYLADEKKPRVQYLYWDAVFRSETSTQKSDQSKLQQAINQLQDMLGHLPAEQKYSPLYNDLQESVGDTYFRKNYNAWWQAWTHYQEALQGWAQSTDLALAKQKYLQLVFKMGEPSWRDDYYYYGYYGNTIPLSFIDDALKIATDEAEMVHLHYLRAMGLKYQGVSNREQALNVLDSFEKVVAKGKSHPYHDDALFYMAEFLVQYSSLNLNYIKALAYYEQLLSAYQKGETRHYDAAKRAIQTIKEPHLTLSTGEIFLPDSVLRLYIQWRNVDEIKFDFYALDLTRDLWTENNQSAAQILTNAPKRELSKVFAFSHRTLDEGKHAPKNEMIPLSEKLGVGAYLVEASAGGKVVRELMLVTDGAVVLRSGTEQGLVYVCEAEKGKPIPEAEVHFYERTYNGKNYVWKRQRQKSGEDGLVNFPLAHDPHRYGREYLVVTKKGETQAITMYNDYDGQNQEKKWKIYAYTDRSAYRPEEAVQWKVIARELNDLALQLPSQKQIKIYITDPQGNKVHEETYDLNAFGSCWDTLALTKKMPLGEYCIYFHDMNNQSIGQEILFRMEEYTLPEYTVQVNMPLKNEEGAAYRLGDTLPVEISAQYYFGGAVANASVEVVVYQKNYTPYWEDPKDYPWYYEQQRNHHYYGPGQQFLRQSLKLDAEGKAILSLNTPNHLGQNIEFTIEARVTDASRREIIGQGLLKVSTRPYDVFLKTAHQIYRPQSKVKVLMRARTAMGEGIPAEGKVCVYKKRWRETWQDPTMEKPVPLDQLLTKYGSRDEALLKQCVLHFNGYVDELVFSETVTCNAEGNLDFNFVPEKAGLYQVTWQNLATDEHAGQCQIWVSDENSTDLHTRHGRLEIILDQESIQSDASSAVMLTLPGFDQYVVFSIESETLHEWKLYHVSGNTKWIPLPIKEKYAPNVFLSAFTVNGGRIDLDTKEIIVPPVKQFLQMELCASKKQLKPQEQNRYLLKVKDYLGKPVQTEFSFAVVDASTFYIQSDLHGDPRAFFYGDKRQHNIRLHSSFENKRYLKLLQDEEGQIGTAQELEQARRQNTNSKQILEAQDYTALVAGHRLERGLSLDDRLDSDKGLDAPMEESVSEAKGLEFLLLDERLSKQERTRKEKKEAKKDGEAEGLPADHNSIEENKAVVVRSDFRSTLFWQPDLQTDAQGEAQIDVHFADALTRWQGVVRGISANHQVGMAKTMVQTKLPMMARLQAPRFFVCGDQATVSILVNNYTENEVTFEPWLEVEGLTLIGPKPKSSYVLGSLQEIRIDWQIQATGHREAKVKAGIKSPVYSDAMEKKYPVYEHGMEANMHLAGKTKQHEQELSFHIPQERRAGSLALSFQVTPSLALMMLDALPYLIDYPYGCTEQTLSRFVPTVLVLKTLNALGLDASLLENKLFGGIEKQYLAKTHPKGSKNLSAMNDMITKGLDRIYSFQHTDGGYGWWQEGESDHFMSSYVLFSLALAKQANVTIKDGGLRRLQKFLREELVEEENNPDMQAFMLYALSLYAPARAHEFELKAIENLYPQKDSLNSYSKALLALSAWTMDDKAKAKILVENLENGVIEGEGTAHWGEEGIYYHWSDGGVEATAFVLLAMLAIEPDHRLVDPAALWLIKNRRGHAWKSTKDTAIVILALTEYIKVKKELKQEGTIEILLNGSRVKEMHITAQNILSLQTVYTLDEKLISEGENKITLRQKDKPMSLYYALAIQFYSLEEPIPARGNELFVKRDYKRWVNQPTLLKGYQSMTFPLKEGDLIQSGERIEVTLTLEAKNHYEYLLLEDFKPAGLETVQLKSGTPVYTYQLQALDLNQKTGHQRWVYQELRDQKTSFFIDKLPEGYWQLSYTLRAQTPGTFHALPAVGYAMYVPEIKGNSKEVIFKVEDIPSR